MSTDVWFGLHDIDGAWEASERYDQIALELADHNPAESARLTRIADRFRAQAIASSIAPPTSDTPTPKPSACHRPALAVDTGLAGVAGMAATAATSF